MTPDEKIVDRDYFYFLMKNLKPHFTQIATNKQTTGLGHVTIADIKRMSVVIPSLDVQREMVSYIKPIDDKIELNNEINNNLEQQAKALYKDWFLIFIPFQLKVIFLMAGILGQSAILFSFTTLNEYLFLVQKEIKWRKYTLTTVLHL